MSELFESIMQGFKEIGELTHNEDVIDAAQYYLENGADTETTDKESNELITV